jgi:hypothetical protein
MGQRMLSLYRFRHILFQSYLYGQMTEGEKIRWHGILGDVLEEIHGDQREGISLVLARHFEYATGP